MDRQLRGQLMPDAPVVFIDCDGVLVDNLEFEQRVTKTIIAIYAQYESISIDAAAANWSAELSRTRGDSRWYDYSFHVSRLGLDGLEVSRIAHNASRDLLRLVNGADVTLRLLQEYGIQACVVTDATRWVVDFKLSTLGIESALSIFSSTEAATTKASGDYWRKLCSYYPNFHPRALVDNRQINLSTADKLIGLPHLVQFDKEEHVMTLSTTEAPTSVGFGEERIQVVRNHDELQAWIKANILY